MVAIKFKRIGKKHQASFRIIVCEKHKKIEGLFTEDLGWFDPKSNTHELNKKQALYWLSVGAQPTPTVWNLFVKAGITHGAKLPVHKKAKTGKEEGGATPVQATPTAPEAAPEAASAA